ncbi:MAG: hypothetical protein KY464_15215 [Gemmatimonadetes bacterium]|nr:hypothetical protein [Gemmatimonadota bacterium]
MKRLLQRAVLGAALVLAASAAQAQKVAAPARPGTAQHYLLVDRAGNWRHASPALGELAITLETNGTYRFTQTKAGKTKRLAGEYAFVDNPRSQTGADLLLFSGPRAANKQPAVKWSFAASGKDGMVLRSRAFYRAR